MPAAAAAALLVAVAVLVLVLVPLLLLLVLQWEFTLGVHAVNIRYIQRYSYLRDFKRNIWVVIRTKNAVEALHLFMSILYCVWEV